jgi:hypothetical protein
MHPTKKIVEDVTVDTAVAGWAVVVLFILSWLKCLCLSAADLLRV